MPQEIERGSITDQGPGWGREQFDRDYSNQIRKILRSFAIATETSIALEINSEVLFRIPRSGSNKFCEELRKLSWGEASCRLSEEQASVVAASQPDNVHHYACHMGLENHVVSFEVAGLGAVTIRMGRIMPPTEDVQSTAIQALSYAQKEGNITMGQRKRLSELVLEEAGSQGSPSNSHVTSLFIQIAVAIRRLLRMGIAQSLVTRSSLHEISVNLTAIRGAAEYLLFKRQDPRWQESQEIRERVLVNVETIADQVLLTQYLTYNLLEYHSRGSDTGVSLGTREAFHITSELEKMALIWERNARERGIEIRTDLMGDAIVIGDPILLKQMFHNLFSNAVKYSYATSSTSDKRYISVSCRRHDPGFREERLAIRISNYGVGILDEEIPRLGEPGFRGRLAAKEQPIGLGIGLYLAKQIARMHGGEVKCEARFLHDSERQVRGELLQTKTYQVDAIVILPRK